MLLSKVGLGGIASAADITAGTVQKLIDAAGLKSFLPKRTFSLNDFIRIPDVPGGLILQWGASSGTDANGLVTVTHSTPFPTNGLIAVCSYYGGTRNAITTQVASVTPTTSQFFASGVSGAAAAGAPFRYLIVGF